MGIEKFTIDLDSPHAKYSSGFKIKGKVKFQISGHETASGKLFLLSIITSSNLVLILTSSTSL